MKLAELTDMASRDGDVTRRRWQRSGKSNGSSPTVLPPLPDPNRARTHLDLTCRLLVKFVRAVRNIFTDPGWRRGEEEANTSAWLAD